MEELLLYLLKSAGLMSLFLLVYKLLLHKDTSFQANRHFLLTGILTAAVLPAVTFTRMVSLPIPTSQTGIPVSSGPAALPEASFQINGWEIAAVVYLLVAAALFLRVLLQLLSLLRIIRGGTMTKEGPFTIVRTERKIAPFSFFQYIVFNPDLHSEEDLRNILAHEKTHASQWHSLDVLLANLATAVCWFNPLSWSYRNSLVQNLEYLADRETVAAVPKKEYQHTLVKLSIATQPPLLANNFYQSLIKKRILMLNKKPTQNRSLWKFGTVLPLLLGFMLAFNVETKAQVTSGESKITEFSLGISPETKDTRLRKLEKLELLKENGVELRFSEVQRSAGGLITNIRVSYKTDTGAEGFHTVNDSEGIEPFTVVWNEKGIHFTQPLAFEASANTNPLEKIEEHPLFIINGEEYTSKKLKGKVVRITSVLSTIAPENARDQYGRKAKDGVIVIEKGKIMDYDDAFKDLDINGEEQKAHYIAISGKSKPIFLKVSAKITNISFDKDKQASKNGDINASLAPTKETSVYSDSEKPMIVLDGETMAANFSFKSVNPDEIHSVNVLKDASAEAAYGKEAGERGVVVIVTEDAEESIKTRVKVSKESSKGISNSEGAEHTPLYVVNGKLMNKDFDPDSIDPETIASISVLKGKNATDKYGEKAANGVIEIKTK